MLRSFPLAPGILVAATIAVASAQTLAVLSGDGQVTVQNFQTEFPLVVVATNASGQPAPGVTVTWSLTGPGNLVGSAQTVTDSNGQASSRFVGATIYGDTAFTQSTVTASAGASSVSMHVTTSGTDLTSGEIFVQPQINSPMLGQVLSGPSGGTANAQVQVYVFGVHQAGAQVVPNVSVVLIPENPNGPSLACAPGTSLTGQNGIANCQVVFSGPPGTGIYDILVGGYRTFSGFSFTVTQGSTTPPVTTPQTETISITGGNNQSGLPGSRLPLSLTARVQNSSGVPLPNVQVVWTPGAFVSLSNIVSTSDSNGMVSAIATLGSAAGPLQVQLRTADGAAQATFNLTATSSGTTTPGQGQPASIRITGGNNQSGAPGARLPSPLTAQVVDSAGNPLPNVAVGWQTGSSVSLSNVVSTTDSNGMVSAQATLGFTPGAAQVEVQAGSSGAQTPFGSTAGAAVQAVFTLTTLSQTVGTPSQGQAASIRINSGNNQSGAPGTRLATPLRAQIVDGSGNPLPNVTASWLPGPSVFLSNVVSTSDANGFVTATATLGSTPGSTQVQVQAGTPGIATPFGTTNGSFVVAIFNLAVTQSQPLALRIVSGANQSGSPGARLPLALTAQVVDGFGNPVTNATVIWQTSASVSLSNIVSTSDGNGMVSAIATLGSAPGAASVQVQTGGSVVVFNLTAVQTQPVLGPPSIIQIIGGNNQSGAPGSQLPSPLTARITDAAGNPMPNIPVAWQPQSASLSNVVSVSEANGLVSATATLGPSVGPAQVQLQIANGAAQATFTLQASLTLSGLSILTGTNQTTVAGATFPQSVTVQLFTLEGPAGGLPVQFTSTGVPVVISGAGSATTDPIGLATITIQAGSQTGVAIVTASAGRFASSVYLVVQAAQPVVPPLSFYNAASNQPGPISPTEILSVYGAGIAAGIGGCVTPNAVLGPLPFSLSGMQVQFANNSGYSAFAPLYSVCNFGAAQQYAVVEVPADLPLADTTVTVLTAGSPAGSSVVAAAVASPGIFETAMSDGTPRAVLQRQDGSYVSLENPAQPEEQLNAFVTGLGRPVTASGIAIGTNQTGISGDDAPPAVPITIEVGGEAVPLISGVYSQSTIGVYVLTFAVPADALSGTDISFTITAPSGGTTIAANPSKIPVQW